MPSRRRASPSASPSEAARARAWSAPLSEASIALLFPAAGNTLVKDRVNAIALAPIQDCRRDFDFFGEAVRAPEAQRLTATAMTQGFQTLDAELALGRVLADLITPAR